MSELNLTRLSVSSSAAIQNMRAIPRFGNPNNFSYIFSKDDGDQDEYLAGLLYVSGLIFAFFFFWTFFLLCFKILGENRVGFLAGGDFIQPAPKNGKRKAYRTPDVVRSIFVSSGIIVMIFGVLLGTQGVKRLTDTVESIEDNNEEVSEIVTEAGGVLTYLSETGQVAKAYGEDILLYLNGFCPNNPAIEQITGIDFDTVTTLTASELEEIAQFVDTDVVRTQDAINQVAETTEDIDDYLEWYNNSDLVSLAIMGALVILPGLLIAGSILASCEMITEALQCSLSWCILPLYILVVIMSWIGCSGLVITAMMNADFCLGGAEKTPEASILEIMYEQSIDPKSLEYQAVTYYITNCVNTYPFQFIAEYESDLVQTQAALSSLKTNINNFGIGNLTVLCSRDYTLLMDLFPKMDETLEGLIQNARVATELLRCETIAPLYVDTVRDATCNYSGSGFAWAFASLFVISFLGLLMVCFRSSWQDEIPYDFRDIGRVAGDNDFAEHTTIPVANKRKAAQERASNVSVSSERTGVEIEIVKEGDPSEEGATKPKQPQMKKEATGFVKPSWSDTSHQDTPKEPAFKPTFDEEDIPLADDGPTPTSTASTTSSWQTFQGIRGGYGPTSSRREPGYNASVDDHETPLGNQKS